MKDPLPGFGTCPATPGVERAAKLPLDCPLTTTLAAALRKCGVPSGGCSWILPELAGGQALCCGAVAPPAPEVDSYSAMRACGTPISVAASPSSACSSREIIPGWCSVARILKRMPASNSV